MQIRAQAHFRFNRMERFRTAFRAACKEVERRGREVLPLAFSYAEGTASSKALPCQPLHFRLWDRGIYLEANPEADRRGRRRSRLRIHTSAATPRVVQAARETAAAELVGRDAAALAVKLGRGHVEIKYIPHGKTGRVSGPYLYQRWSEGKVRRSRLSRQTRDVMDGDIG